MIIYLLILNIIIRKNHWKDAEVQNIILIEDPMMRVPTFNLPRYVWTALNR